MQSVLYFRCKFAGNPLILHLSPTRNARAYLTLHIFNLPRENRAWGNLRNDCILMLEIEGENFIDQVALFQIASGCLLAKEQA